MARWLHIVLLQIGRDADRISYPYAASGQRSGLVDDVRATLESVRPHAAALACEEGLERIAETLRAGNDARWMSDVYARSESLPDLVYRQAERWRGLR